MALLCHALLVALFHVPYECHRGCCDNCHVAAVLYLRLPTVVYRKPVGLAIRVRCVRVACTVRLAPQLPCRGPQNRFDSGSRNSVPVFFFRILVRSMKPSVQVLANHSRYLPGVGPGEQPFDRPQIGSPLRARVVFTVRHRVMFAGAADARQLMWSVRPVAVVTGAGSASGRMRMDMLCLARASVGRSTRRPTGPRCQRCGGTTVQRNLTKCDLVVPHHGEERSRLRLRDDVRIPPIRLNAVCRLGFRRRWPDLLVDAVRVAVDRSAVCGPAWWLFRREEPTGSARRSTPPEDR
jgi:hypothetical protein